ncbi:MAG TPA: FAD-dependent oxidoreductase [Steroidobacteraceae bacterium]|nr:FAD-dependent oxidoreductase [Steroidobacteraceae bacterium]
MTGRYDVLVVGAGPGGLEAARTAAAHGARVGVADMQPRSGGQVWRHDVRRGAPRAARAAAAALAHVDQHFGCQVIDGDRGELLLEHERGALRARFDRLILATGARELLLPFPGWTLPGVTGAGGLQALVKQGLPVDGKHAVVAGSGPLLLAAAATLHSHGARVLGIFEQASAQAVSAFARRLWRWPARAAQAARLRLALHGVDYHFAHVVSAAYGEDAVRSVAIEDHAGRQQRIDCDLLAVGYGLVPNVELAALLGCALEPLGAHQRVRVDALQRTTVANIYAAGEVCGIGGLQAARLEGAIAAHTALGDLRSAHRLHASRERARRFAEAVTKSFGLGPRVRALAGPDTIVCRCEDVPLSALQGFTESRAAKLATRCGMGACQGRICGAALAELFQFVPAPPRAPLFPARLGSLVTAPAGTRNGAGERAILPGEAPCAAPRK